MYHNPFGFEDDGFGQFPGQRAAGAGAFTRNLRCYPVSFMDRAELEKGDKIILPPSALERLTQLNISYPMLFQLEGNAKKAHCGVLEFLAQEGHAYVPYWMMQNMSVNEGDMITIRNVVLEKGNYVKFQPQSVDFLSISNPKAVLEKILRGFTCLSTGDSFPINYNGKNYWIDVLDVKPGTAVSIIDTDINVDFAPPIGYVEPSGSSLKEMAPMSRSGEVIFGGPAGGKQGAASGGKGKGRKLVESSDSDTDNEDEKAKEKSLEERFPGEGSVLRKPATGRAYIPTASTPSASAESKPLKESVPFIAFGGSGRTLRGKTVAGATAAPPTPTEMTTTTAEQDQTPPDAAKDEEEEQEKSKFVAFGGTGRRLRD